MLAAVEPQKEPKKADAEGDKLGILEALENAWVRRRRRTSSFPPSALIFV